MEGHNRVRLPVFTWRSQTLNCSPSLPVRHFSMVDRLLIDWRCAPITGDLKVFKTHQLVERKRERRRCNPPPPRDVGKMWRWKLASGLVRLCTCWWWRWRECLCTYGCLYVHLRKCMCCLTTCVCSVFIVGSFAVALYASRVNNNEYIQSCSYFHSFGLHFYRLWYHCTPQCTCWNMVTWEIATVTGNPHQK